MSVVAAVEKILAEAPDAVGSAFRHLAAEVEKFAGGGIDPTAIETAIDAKVKEVVSPFLKQIEDAFKSRVEDLEGQMAKLTAQVQGQPATPAPAPQPAAAAPASAAPAQTVAPADPAPAAPAQASAAPQPAPASGSAPASA